jgi:hypothetical protein
MLAGHPGVLQHHHPSSSDDEDHPPMAEDDSFYLMFCFILRHFVILFWIICKHFITLGLFLLYLPLSCCDIKGSNYIVVFLILCFTLYSFETKNGSSF